MIPSSRADLLEELEVVRRHADELEAFLGRHLQQ